ncbi:translation initiation factor IF-2 [Desulfovibrio sp.]|uniref:translation initiation factor IF-2 n=1 Tax=Desulfovibrio sp. TaxID=885 RepID=UPI0035B05F80
MSLPAVASLIAFTRKHTFVLAAILLVILAAVGGYSGWRHYQFRQTAEFAFSQLKDALRPVKPADLAVRVDFAAITKPLVKAVVQHYPALKQGPNQTRDLSDMIQIGLLKQARIKEEPAKEETDEVARLKTPLYLLPPTFYTQLAETLTLQNPTDTTALIAAKVRHPVLNKEFSILLRMDKTPEGWRVDDFVNAEDIVRQFREYQMERMVAQRQIILDKNANIKKRMEDILPIRSCTASAGLISDGKTLLVVVNVKSKNNSSVMVSNMDLFTKIYAPDGTELLQRYLNAVQPTASGEDFERNWTIELDGESALGKAILSARKLTCDASWKTLGMANGEVLHFAVAPALLEEFQ